MADVNVKLTLAFATGEEQVYVAKVPQQNLAEPSRKRGPTGAPLYRISSFTAPAEPVLVRSTTFVEVG
jgi:hypothetical protein